MIAKESLFSAVVLHVCVVIAGGSVVVTSASEATPLSAESRLVLPIASGPFRGKIDATRSGSVPDWPRAVQAPANAPNVLLIMTDDVGFGTSSTFGGPIPTSNLDRLAKAGLRYSNFHTTAMCSPTRAALLTGRNPHAVGSGAIVDVASGFPGYTGVIPKSAATIARVLTANGYSTASFGKHHNIPSWENSAAGPFDHWPTGLGFEYFYGFVIGSTDQWSPKLYRNTQRVNEPLPDGQTLDHALASDAIQWIHQQKAAAPDKPFFVYLAPGSGHAPHQAPREWIDKFKGSFDQGWDQVRKRTFEKQKALGIIPRDAVLTSRPAAMPAWNSLSPAEQRLYARHMEVFAGMMAYQDHEIGRLLDELERIGQLEQTLVLFLVGDNGAPAEGGLSGSQNEIGLFANGIGNSPALESDALETMGGKLSQPIFPAPWAWALDAPFQWTKQVASHLGGIRNGLVVSWPGHVAKGDQIRRQFSYVTDIFPTILDAAGIPEPREVDGVAQQSIDGSSLRYSFENPDAPERHTTQYFEMFGNRALYHEGWFANTVPKRDPWNFADPGGDVMNDYRWELYDLRKDFTQSKDLAARNPQKLRELQALWLKAAEQNNVLPLDDRTNRARRGEAKAQLAPARPRYEYWGKKVSVTEWAAPSFTGRSFAITADIEPLTQTDTGVIVARGSLFGGWSFYLKEGRAVAEAVFSSRTGDQFAIASADTVPARPTTLRFNFTYDGGGVMRGGKLCIVVNGGEPSCGHIERTVIRDAGQGESFDIGQDTGVPVTDAYEGYGAFPGEIKKVIVDVSEPTPHAH